MSGNNPQTAINKACLLVADDNYIQGLIAQINSLLREMPNTKIYLVHRLSDDNLAKIQKYIYKSEPFNKKPWKHLPPRDRHVTITGFGRFQVDFIEEKYFLYIDTDIIVQRKFNWEFPKTISTEFKLQPINKNIKGIDRIELMREFILKNKGLTEPKKDFILFPDAAFIANKNWFVNVLRPKIIEVSKQYLREKIPQRWFDMQYFHSAICILKQQISKLKIKNAWLGLPFTKKDYPKFFNYKNIADCELLHFVGPEKPWTISKKKRNKAMDIWWNYYLNGPVKPL